MASAASAMNRSSDTTMKRGIVAGSVNGEMSDSTIVLTFIRHPRRFASSEDSAYVLVLPAPITKAPTAGQQP